MRLPYFGISLVGFVALCLIFGCGRGIQEMVDSSVPRQTSIKTASTEAKNAVVDTETAETKLVAAKGYAKDVLPLYIDSAKVFSQMAIAALGLTVIFKEKVLGKTGPMKVSRLLMGSWACFLIAIGAGVSYQWLAIRLISLKNGYETAYFPLNYGVFWPGNIFGLMLIAFFSGVILLVVTSATELSSRDVVNE